MSFFLLPPSFELSLQKFLSDMKNTFLFLTFLLTLFNANSQTTITAWTFDNSSTNPTTGSGTLSIIGGTTQNSTAFLSGNGSGSLSYSITNFPAQENNNGTAGYQFMVSTVGYSGIILKFDPRGSDSSSKWQQYEYTTNGGTTWNLIRNNNGGLTNGFTTTPMINITLTDPACNNNAQFGFRIVSILNPATSNYEPVFSTATYATTGVWRIDNVRVEAATLSNEKLDNISGLKVYPSPASTELFVTSNSLTEKQVELYNLLGKKALVSKVTISPINISNLPKGIYIAKITEEGKTATRKIIIE